MTPNLVWLRTKVTPDRSTLWNRSGGGGSRGGIGLRIPRLHVTIRSMGAMGIA